MTVIKSNSRRPKSRRPKWLRVFKWIEIVIGFQIWIGLFGLAIFLMSRLADYSIILTGWIGPAVSAILFWFLYLWSCLIDKEFDVRYKENEENEKNDSD